jgi:hypothetical protein
MKEETEGKDQRHREQGARCKEKTRRKTGVKDFKKNRGRLLEIA